MKRRHVGLTLFLLSPFVVLAILIVLIIWSFEREQEVVAPRPDGATAPAGGPD